MANYNNYRAIHAIVDANYQAAINRYNSQRMAFEMSLTNNTNAQKINFIEQLNNTIEQEIMSGELNDDFDKAFSTIQDQVQNLFISILENGTAASIASYQQLMQAFKQKMHSGKEHADNVTQANLDNFYNRLINDIDIFLTTNGMTRNFIQSILPKSLEASNANKEVILNQFYGYTRRTLMSILTLGQFQVSTVNYKKSLKGYYKEDLLVKALEKTLHPFNLTAYGTGAIPNDSGQQIEIDILIRKPMLTGENQLETLIKQLQSISGSNAIATTQMGEPTTVGIQSKSWIEPWTEGGPGANKKWLSVGHRMRLLNSLAPDGLYSWHEGISLASAHIQEIIGVNNILFSTGNGIKWTADLISDFREHQYYLAFYISKKNHQATGEIAWEQDASC